MPGMIANHLPKSVRSGISSGPTGGLHGLASIRWADLFQHGHIRQLRPDAHLDSTAAEDVSAHMCRGCESSRSVVACQAERLLRVNARHLDGLAMSC